MVKSGLNLNNRLQFLLGYTAFMMRVRAVVTTFRYFIVSIVLKLKNGGIGEPVMITDISLLPTLLFTIVITNYPIISQKKDHFFLN